jgi:hypothetical protein
VGCDFEDQHEVQLPLPPMGDYPMLKDSPCWDRHCELMCDFDKRQQLWVLRHGGPESEARLYIADWRLAYHTQQIRDWSRRLHAWLERGEVIGPGDAV